MCTMSVQGTSSLWFSLGCMLSSFIEGMQSDYIADGREGECWGVRGVALMSSGLPMSMQGNGCMSPQIGEPSLNTNTNQ